jgi:hypothetical protein
MFWPEGPAPSIPPLGPRPASLYRPWPARSHLARPATSRSPTPFPFLLGPEGQGPAQPSRMVAYRLSPCLSVRTALCSSPTDKLDPPIGDLSIPFLALTPGRTLFSKIQDVYPIRGSPRCRCRPLPTLSAALPQIEPQCHRNPNPPPPSSLRHFVALPALLAASWPTLRGNKGS